MLEHLELRDVGPSPEMRLDFAPRLNVLTGDNGLGKSFILDIAWWVLTRSWWSTPAWPHRGSQAKPTIGFGLTLGEVDVVNLRARYDFEQQAWRSRFPRRIRYLKPGLVVHAEAHGCFSIWDPARNSWGNDVSRADRPASYRFSRKEVWNGLKKEDRVLCKGLIEDWVLWQGREHSAFGQLKRVLERLSPDEREKLTPGEPTRVWLDDVRDIPTIVTPYGTIPLTFASAGARRVIALAYLIVWTWQEHLHASRLLNQEPENRIVFLIDELDAHLHPKWQRVLLPALLAVAEELTDAAQAEVQVLITTHSPMVLASLEPIFEPETDSVLVFDLVDSEVKVSKDSWRPRGDAAAWLTSEVFDLGQARSLPAEKAIAEAMEAMKRPDLEFEEAQRIHEELHKVLKDSDPFWVRWRYRAEQAGLEA